MTLVILKFLGFLITVIISLFIGVYAAEQVRKVRESVNDIEKQFIKEEEIGV